MDTKVVVRVDSLSKDFKLPSENMRSVKSIFTNFKSFRNNSYKTQHALKNISFEVRQGEFFGIVGRNGSGKSTLLKLIAGIYQPSKGSVTTIGRIVPFIELGVGFNPELSGKDNVYLNGAMLGFDNKFIDAKYKDIVEFAELERFMEQKLRNYSSGMQVRLAFSVATILAESDVLLLDEVLAVGDADFQRKCFDYFRQLKKMKKTVIFISHDMDAIREYCDRAILIDNSKIRFQGTPDEVATYYKQLFSEDYQESDSNQPQKRWGEKKVEFISVELDKKQIQPEDKTINIVCEVEGKEEVENVIFGFSITDSTGLNLFGTNTSIKLKKSVSMKKGAKNKIIWEIPNIFNEGNFYVNVACIDSSGTTTFDWWDEAERFRVSTNEKTPYPVNPEVKVSIS
jgi:ABC-2 type transport system ATP-binding protein